MTQGTALAKIAKVYLKETSSKTYDMRSFEFWNGNNCFTKVQHLLRAVQFFKLNEEEQQAKSILENSGLQAIQNDIDYIKELVLYGKKERNKKA